MAEKVLVIDDDVELLELAQTWLGNAGLESLTATDGIQGMRLLYSERPDLALVDIRLPQIDGWEVCRRIREMCDMPIIVVSVNGGNADVLRGFSLGIDDYIRKPFHPPELVARVQAVLRRGALASQAEERPGFHSQEIDVDWGSHEVYVCGERVNLSPTEFRLLECLVRNRGWVVTHEELLTKAWGPTYLGDRSYVKLYIRYLRQKIEQDPANPKLVLTKRGVGYQFVG